MRNILYEAYCIIAYQPDNIQSLKIRDSNRVGGIVQASAYDEINHWHETTLMINRKPFLHFCHLHESGYWTLAGFLK